MASQNPFTSAQAPAYNLIAPDIAAEQAKLARQQQLADMLRGRALADEGQTQVINGWAVPQSPLAGISKVLQGGLSGYLQQKNDAKQAELAQALSGRVSSLFSDSPSPSAPSQAMPEQDPGAQAMPVDMPDPSGNSMLPQAAPGQGAMPNAPRGGNLLIPGMNPRTAELAYATDPNAYMAALLRQTDPTEMQKNDRYLGISAAQTRQSELAKRLKDGTMSLQPGQTNVLPDGQRMVAPNFETGVAGGFNAQGMPVAGEIPGAANIAANRAGQVAAATAAAQAQNDMVTVNTSTGPVMMTKAQAIQQSNGGGGAPQAARPQPPQAMPQGAGLNNMTPAQKDAFYKQAEAQFGLRFQGQGQGAAAPARGPGIALQDQGSSAFETTMGNKSADKLLESRDTARAANDQLISISESRKAIKAGAYQGFGSDAKTDAIKMAQGFGIPIDDAKASNSEYLRSTLASGILANAKKLGTNPTEGDTRLLNQILGGLGKDPKAMDKLLDLQEKMAVRSIDQHNNDISSAAASGGKFPFDMTVKRYTDTPAAAPKASAPAATAKTFDAPPPAAQFAGKRMRAPDGSIMRSNGKTWVKE